MTMSLQVSALPSEDLDRIRAAGIDAFGNPLEVTVSTVQGSPPLRCCLREAALGERVALLAWQPASVPGPYAEVGPVFVHAETCRGWTAEGYPEAFRHRQQLFRAYDHQGRAVHNEIAEGTEAEHVLTELLARPEVAYVHSRNVLAGCYMFRVDATG